MQSLEILGSDSVRLEEMLAERERRAETQRRFLDACKSAVVCLSVNMAGPVKDFPLLRCAFWEGRRLAENALRSAGISWALLQEDLGKCGPCAFYRVDGAPAAAKAVLCAVEDATPLGRLLDLDVLDPSGRKISRQDIGHPPRRCLLCEENAAICGRSRRHGVEQLQRETIRRILEYFSASCADHVSACAEKAMLYEVSVTPKPGLVDRWNSGAHQDMDFFTFLDSTAALTAWFRRFSQLGFHQAETPDDTLFQSARQLGREAETAMFAATNGVNTHKGLIFSLGLLCVAAGQLYKQRLLAGRAGFPETGDLCSRAAALAAHSLGDLCQQEAAASHGMEVYRSFQAEGVRREAADGFPSVKKWVLPALKQSGSLEDNGKRALLTLFSVIEDTNVLHRGGPEALQALRERARLALASPEDFEGQLAALDRVLRQDGISPGGCADLLAIGYFLLFLNA